MNRLACALLACFWATSAYPVDTPVSASTDAGELSVPEESVSVRMEKDLQSLDWAQFRSVIEAVPKMKADVDAYGAVGWQYVQANYRTYAWRKNIDRLDDERKAQLADLIQLAKHGR